MNGDCWALLVFFISILAIIAAYLAYDLAYKRGFIDGVNYCVREIEKSQNGNMLAKR